MPLRCATDISQRTIYAYQFHRILMDGEVQERAPAYSEGKCLSLEPDLPGSCLPGFTVRLIQNSLTSISPTLPTCFTKYTNTSELVNTMPLAGGRPFLADYRRRDTAFYAPYRLGPLSNSVHNSYSSRCKAFTHLSQTPVQQSPYFSPFHIQPSPVLEPARPEEDNSLDNFGESFSPTLHRCTNTDLSLDRQLLQESERASELGGQSLFHQAVDPEYPSRSLPVVRQDSYDVHNNDFNHQPRSEWMADEVMAQRTLPASSSSPSSIQSPTVVALQNRHCNRGIAGIRDHGSKGKEPAGSQMPQSVADGGAQPGVNASLEARNTSQRLPVIQGITLVPTAALPDQLRSVFKFDIFNAIQSKCFDTVFHTNDNIVVSAPTSSGKTVLMELAICRLVAECKGQDFKVIYQAPTKSLCAERHRDWQQKFRVLNLQCAELTGDTESGQLRDVQKAHIIITTPEKWDSVTRKWRDHVKLMQMVKLFLVDEVHILKDERGATLEAVVSRMKSVVSDIRFVALSATVPNSDDIATWLGKNSTTQHLPACREVFGESFRPVQLKKHVYGFESRSNDFAFEAMLTQQ
jgi:hypothetical protein